VKIANEIGEDVGTRYTKEAFCISCLSTYPGSILLLENTLLNQSV